MNAWLPILLLFAAAPRDADKPVLRWDFGEEVTRLVPHGGVHRDVAGPRPPKYPDFDAGNVAVKFDGKGAHFSFADSGTESELDFANGDSITLEAWVNLNEIRPGENAYVIGKGRTGEPGYTADNQNWAMRIREQNGKACVSFLFATPVTSEAQNKGTGSEATKRDAHWHRWTTNDGFTPASGWHHIAVTYKFGEPESVHGWVDGTSLPGRWDMGGATKEPPIVDDDAVWIGSSNRASAANSWRGSLDALAVHRAVLPDEVLKSRFKRNGEPEGVKPLVETAPNLGKLAPGTVLVSFLESMPAQDRWLNEGEPQPQEITRLDTSHFLLHRMPLRYDAIGIRDIWKGPMLVRMAADVSLPPGKQQVLLRARGLSRLWINGQIVARTKGLPKNPPDGEEPVEPNPVPPFPGTRPAIYQQQETVGSIEIAAAGTSRVILETVIGGVKQRAESGEICVALLNAEKDGYVVLGADESAIPLPLTNAAVESQLARLEGQLVAHDDRERRRLAGSQNAYWDKRHAAGRDWVRQQPPIAVPKTAAHPIDAFLTQKIERSLAESSRTPAEQSKQFHAQVLPILREQCFRCHGEKEKGGLRLNSRESALKPGDSGLRAIVPGNVDGSELLSRVREKDASLRMPPGEQLKPEQIATLEAWIKSGAEWPLPPLAAQDVAPSRTLSDAEFLRRVALDTIGLPPSVEELRAFLADKNADKRERAIDRYLHDDRWADQWISYWQDVLAENPTLINASLNSTGPFRWFLRDALRDNKPLDRFVTELIAMRGSSHVGGSAGFALAGENDAPFAAKAQIVANAFLGIELQCARCHDSPYHSTKQRDLFSLAAMLERKSVTVPKSSTVPAAFFEAHKSREALIQATLKPGTPVAPQWPFAEVTGISESEQLKALMLQPDDTRERLAMLVTAPQNRRFAAVMVNRIWKRLMGAGMVEPVHDWEGREASHPQLLEWLARELMLHDYDVKHIARLILTSQSYQREASGANLAASPRLRFFNAPERRRLSAEQVVDTLFAATARTIDVEELTFDPTGRRPEGARISLGKPTRAWMFASLTNERDRPSLSLPKAQVVVDVLEAFGWSGARQSPRTDRETDPNVLQPGVLANGALSFSLTRAAYNSPLAELGVAAKSPEELVDTLFLRFVSRLPTENERTRFTEALRPEFASRLTPPAEIKPPPLPTELPRVTWYNHLRAEANEIAIEQARRVQAGPPADPRLRASWREVFEDVVWSLVNTREFVWMP